MATHCDGKRKSAPDYLLDDPRLGNTMLSCGCSLQPIQDDSATAMAFLTLGCGLSIPKWYLAAHWFQHCAPFEILRMHYLGSDRHLTEDYIVRDIARFHLQPPENVKMDSSRHQDGRSRNVRLSVLGIQFSGKPFLHSYVPLPSQPNLNKSQIHSNPQGLECLAICGLVNSVQWTFMDLNCLNCVYISVMFKRLFPTAATPSFFSAWQGRLEILEGRLSTLQWDNFKLDMFGYGGFHKRGIQNGWPLLGKIPI